MPALSAPQRTKTTDVQTALATAKAALRDLADKAGSLSDDMMATGTVDGMVASNEAMALQGVAIELRGRLIQAHGTASKALLAYDEAGGGGIIAAGPIRR